MLSKMTSRVAKHHYQTPFEMARRCGYCGKFCHKSRIHNPSGLCEDCRAELGESSDKGEDDKHMDVEAAEGSGERRLSSDAPGHREHTEHMDDAVGTEAAEEHHRRLFKEKETREKEHPGEESSGKKTSEGNAEQWCGRCWMQPPTQLLYGCPVCDSCVDEAEKEKVRSSLQILFLFLFFSTSPNAFSTIHPSSTALADLLNEQKAGKTGNVSHPTPSNK